jgi:hypothetical protein
MELVLQRNERVVSFLREFNVPQYHPRAQRPYLCSLTTSASILLPHILLLMNLTSSLISNTCNSPSFGAVTTHLGSFC